MKYLENIFQCPPIIQGALGSALFWFILEVAWKLIAVTKSADERIAEAQRGKLVREYIYSKYTNNNGLAYYPQGYFLSFSCVLKLFIVGMMYFAIAFLVGGISRMALAIGLVGALYYFSKALSWLIPDHSGHSKTPLDRWKRVDELEQNLFSKVEDDTKEWISKFEKSNT